MRKVFILFLVLLFFTTRAFLPQKIQAQQLGTQPAKLVQLPQATNEQLERAKILESYLKQYNSPLTPYALEFVQDADKNNIDWKLVASIAGVESYYGNALITGTYNAWGWNIYNGNVGYFSSYKDGIATISKSLREDYMNKWGAKDVYGIGSIYAEDPLWAYKVTNFMQDIQNYANEEQASTLHLSI